LLKIANSPIYAHPLPDNHRFPMAKYDLLPGQLLYEGTVKESQFFEPTICIDAHVLLTHDTAYLQRLHALQLTASEQRAIGFPQSVQLIQRELTIMQGSIDCAVHAIITNSIGINIAGGTHHSFADRGEGFCILNDMAIVANYVLHYGLAKKVLILDLDVHQGNGTAKLFAGSTNVFTCSMHGAHNYPFRKEQSHLDIPLQDGTDTATYLQLLQQHLPVLLDTFQPDLVCYNSGVDILETDKFGKLKVSMQGVHARDRYVLQQLKNNNIPCVVAMGGGYSADVNTIVEAHCGVFRSAMEFWG
jgi:acetoin utilization deacetylase AcuC-like enzyme